MMSNAGFMFIRMQLFVICFMSILSYSAPKMSLPSKMAMKSMQQHLWVYEDGD